MMTNTPPEAPSKNPQWQDQKIQAWRLDADSMRNHMRENLLGEALQHNREWSKQYFGSYGVPEVSEEMVLLLWLALPWLSAFVQARLRQTAPDPLTADTVHRYLMDGLDFAGVCLLELESEIGTRL